MSWVKCKSRCQCCGICACLGIILFLSPCTVSRSKSSLVAQTFYCVVKKLRHEAQSDADSLLRLVLSYRATSNDRQVVGHCELTDPASWYWFTNVENFNWRCLEPMRRILMRTCRISTRIMLQWSVAVRAIFSTIIFDCVKSSKKYIKIQRNIKLF